MNTYSADNTKHSIIVSCEQSHDNTEYSIEHLYHMTHIDNLAGILENGLLSHHKAHAHYNIKDISDREVNARRAGIYLDNRSLHDYVPLYFNPLNPMSYVRRHDANNLVILTLSVDLLSQPGVCFSDGNAACNMTLFFNDIQYLNQLNWKCLSDCYWSNYTYGRRQRCAEVLVPDSISLAYIEQICVKNTRNLNRLLTQTAIPVAVQPELFF